MGVPDLVSDLALIVCNGDLNTLAGASASATRVLVNGTLDRTFFLAIPGGMPGRRANFCFRLLLSGARYFMRGAQKILERRCARTLRLQADVTFFDCADAFGDRTLGNSCRSRGR